MSKTLVNSEGSVVCSLSCAHNALQSLDQLKLNPLNPNKHPSGQVALLAKVISYNGMRSPIVVSKRSGLVVKGHGRILALQQLGATHAPVDVQEYESEEMEYADLVADNTLSELSKTDHDLIKAGLDDLNINIDISLLGLEGLKLKKIELMKPEEGLDLPESQAQRVVTPPQGIFQLSNHLLLCGDSTSITDLEALFARSKQPVADILFTSPPYNVGSAAKLSGSLRGTDKDSLYDGKDDNKDSGNYKDFLNEFFHTCLPFADYHFINIQSLSNNKLAIIEWLNDNRELYNDTMIWDKVHFQPAMAKKVLNVMFEYIYIFNSIGNSSRAIGKREFRGDVHNIYRGAAQRSNEFSKVHNATFPNHLPEFIINTFTEPEMVVLDPFAGTGTTLIECERSSRKCLAIEKEPRYCDIIIERWQKYTGKHAIDLQTGKPFNELKKEMESGNDSP